MMREKYEMGHEKVKCILVNVNYMCVFLGCFKRRCVTGSDGWANKSQRDEIRRWHGSPGPKFQIYWITYRGPFTYIRLWNGVLPLDSVCLQGENNASEGEPESRTL